MGRIKHAPYTVKVGNLGYSTFVFVTFSILRLAQCVTVQGSYWEYKLYILESLRLHWNP